MEKVADTPNSILREKLLREFLAEEEFRIMVKEAKKLPVLECSEKAGPRTFLRQRSRCMNSDFH